jgi:acetyltransferase-like isoleucine patch superfamily enzyme
MLLIGFLPSFIKVFLYKIMGYKIGRASSIGFGSVIVGKDVILGSHVKIGFMTVVRAKSVEIGRYTRIGSMCFIDTEKVVIGEDTRINENVIAAGIRFPNSLLKIGSRSIVMEYCYLNPSYPLEIGDDTGIGGHCLLFTHGSWSPITDGYPVTFAPIKLADKVWLPWRVFVMPGVEIGEGSVIGANSLVSKNVPPHCLVAGSPAKIIKEDYPEKPDNEKLEKIVQMMVNEFKNHLCSHGYKVDLRKTDTDNGESIFRVTRKQAKYAMKLSAGVPSVDQSIDTYVCVSGSHFNVAGLSGNMIIGLYDRVRFGSTELGEEFVAFVSRYGMRFKRLD